MPKHGDTGAQSEHEQGIGRTHVGTDAARDHPEQFDDEKGHQARFDPPEQRGDSYGDGPEIDPDTGHDLDVSQHAENAENTENKSEQRPLGQVRQPILQPLPDMPVPHCAQHDQGHVLHQLECDGKLLSERHRRRFLGTMRRIQRRAGEPEPRRAAALTASTRLRTPSLRKMLRTWSFIVIS
jgi:hypothetical protein